MSRWSVIWLALALMVVGVGRAAAVEPACPSSNPPNTMTLVGGTPQTAKLGTQFAAGLEVALTNTNGCAVTTGAAGVAVTFTAPTSGASGSFSVSGSESVTVGANATGLAVAPPFAANGSAGSYTVVATSEYGSVSFSLTNTPSGVATSLAGAGATSQSATVGTHYAQPLQVKLLDANGNPVRGASITFSLGSGASAASSAAGAGATFDGGGTQATELTDDAGIATSPLFAANAVAGAFTASAAAAGVVQPVVFALDNLVGKPPTLAAVGRTARTATVGGRFSGPLEVRVRDANGKPLQGASLTFSLGGASGTGAAGATFLGGATQATAVADADGVATSPLFVANGVPGRFTATASMSGVREPVSFTLDNLAARSPTIEVAGGARRTATAGSGYAQPLRVRVLDGGGHPVHGASVTFTLGSSSAASGTGESSAGATFAGGTAQATALTDAAGVATSPRFAANDVAGRLTATATTAGTSQAASFSLRNLAGRPTDVKAGVAATASAAVRAAFPVRLAVTVTDANGNPVPNAVVTFSAPVHGPSGRFGSRRSRSAKVETNASGIAVAPSFTANAEAGGYVVRAAVQGVSRPAAFALVNRRP